MSNNIYGFGDEDKRRVPINLKRGSSNEIIAINSSGNEVTIPTIKQIIPISYKEEDHAAGHFYNAQMSQLLDIDDPQKCFAIIYATSGSEVTNSFSMIEAILEIAPVTGPGGAITGYVVKGELYHTHQGYVKYSGYVIETY